MSRIVLVTTGSLGDLHPFLAIGSGLKARGHDVVIASSEFYRRHVLAEELEFGSLGGLFALEFTNAETARKTFDRRAGLGYVLKQRVFPFLEQNYHELLTICSQADLIVGHPMMLAVPLVAEKLGVPWMTAVLTPHTFLSACDPPRLSSVPWLYRLRWMGPLPQKVVLGLLKAGSRKLAGPLMRLREKEGLHSSPGASLFEGLFSSFGTIACFSPRFAAPQKDWPQRTTATGFPLYDRVESVESIEPSTDDETRLEAFLAAGTPPVVFTLGSAAVLDPGEFYTQGAAAAQSLGCRAVLLTGRGPASHAALASPSTLVAGYAPFARLFPRAAVVVHHGGIGTVAQALRAGVPSLVVPRGIDQPDNAARLKRLGVALTIEPEDYRSEAVAARLRRLLEEPSFRNRAQALAHEIAAEDGVGNACAAMERVCHG